MYCVQAQASGGGASLIENEGSAWWVMAVHMLRPVIPFQGTESVVVLLRCLVGAYFIS